jgi:hypothetical protein
MDNMPDTLLKVSETRHMNTVPESFHCVLSATKRLLLEIKDEPLMFHAPFRRSKSYFIRIDHSFDPTDYNNRMQDYIAYNSHIIV